jgi:hypothetical protein
VFTALCSLLCVHVLITISVVMSPPSFSVYLPFCCFSTIDSPMCYASSSTVSTSSTTPPSANKIKRTKSRALVVCRSASSIALHTHCLQPSTPRTTRKSRSLRKASSSISLSPSTPRSYLLPPSTVPVPDPMETSLSLPAAAREWVRVHKFAASCLFDYSSATTS